MFNDAEKCHKALVLKEKWLKSLSVVVRWWRLTVCVLPETFPFDKKLEFNIGVISEWNVGWVNSELSYQWSTNTLTDHCSACSDGKIIHRERYSARMKGQRESLILYNCFLKCITMLTQLSQMTATTHLPLWCTTHPPAQLCYTLWCTPHTVQTVWPAHLLSALTEMCWKLS